MGRLARQAIRSGVLLAALTMAATSHGVERPGDLEAAVELDSVAFAVAQIQRDRLSRCENAVGDAQLELYREYNQSMGTWHSVDTLRDLIDAATDARSPADEERIRSDIGDHARFVAWELDEHVAQLIEVLLARGPTPDWQLGEEIRLARQAREVVVRLTGKRPPG